MKSQVNIVKISDVHKKELASKIKLLDEYTFKIGQLTEQYNANLNTLLENKKESSKELFSLIRAIRGSLNLDDNYVFDGNKFQFERMKNDGQSSEKEKG